MVDRRGFGIIGAIFAMVIAGLAVYAIVNYGPGIWREIQKGAPGGGNAPSGENIPSGGNALSPVEVRQHPDKYFGQEITVDGYWWEWVMPIGMMSQNSVVQSPEEFIATYGGTGLLSGGTYRITGILKAVPTSILDSTWGLFYSSTRVSVYLEVTNVEPM